MKPQKILIFIHGWGSSPNIWNSLINLLDLQNYQETLNLTPNQALTFQPTDNIQYDIIGWSLGGMITLQLALNYKNAIHRLVLINSTACFDNPAFDQFAEHFANNPKETLKQFNLLQVKNDQHFRSVLKILNQLDQYYTEHLALLSEFDFRELLSQIHQETLIIHGEQDQIISYLDSLELHENLTKSQCVLFKNVGHIAFLSELHQTASLIQSFLNKI